MKANRKDRTPMIKSFTTSRDILALYAEGPALLEAALNGLTEPDLNLSLADNAWSIRQIVHHLADGDDLWKTCIQAALGNNEGIFTLQWYWDKSQMEWSECWKYSSRSIAPSLALFRANREFIVDLLRQIPDAWDRSIQVQWPQRPMARISVGGVLEMQARHVVDHNKDIHAIRELHNI